MGKIKVENIRVYAHHGCLSQETVIGSDYRVDVTVRAALSKPASTDDLADTVDYVHIAHIVTEEMKVPSKLLEHVAQRIVRRVLREMEMVDKVKISVGKINPPIGGDVEMVTIVLSEKRID